MGLLGACRKAVRSRAAGVCSRPLRCAGAQPAAVCRRGCRAGRAGRRPAASSSAGAGDWNGGQQRCSLRPAPIAARLCGGCCGVPPLATEVGLPSTLQLCAANIFSSCSVPTCTVYTLRTPLLVGHQPSGFLCGKVLPVKFTCQLAIHKVEARAASLCPSWGCGIPRLLPAGGWTQQPRLQQTCRFSRDRTEMSWKPPWSRTLSRVSISPLVSVASLLSSHTAQPRHRQRDAAMRACVACNLDLSLT